MAELRSRHRLLVAGVVQGVGFRPFVYALARRLGLSGSVTNDSSGVIVEVEGRDTDLHDFGVRLLLEAPALAQIHAVSLAVLPCRGGTDFAILDSVSGSGRTLVSADVATCQDCLAELADPADRRYRHPFISCTNCGPRFTIITGLPYDRPATTMAPLPLCARCRREYADPADRRFHAQTVACRDCGPTLTLHRVDQPDLSGDAAMAAARGLLSGGAVVAVKGLGGYHLACDASDAGAVTTLRKRKDRGDKPFAIMVADVATAAGLVAMSDREQQLLSDPRRPVVLVPKRSHRGADPAELQLAADVAPDSPDLGVMLPYTPVHSLLFGLPGDSPGPRALVMTSGNLAGEPIVFDDEEAVARLGELADAWLTHDRRIHIPCDDSVLRIVDSDELPVRRSRGYAPLPIALPIAVRAALAVGSDLKNTFGVGEGRYAWLSGHVGDMDDLATLAAFDTASEHLCAITAVRPEVLVADRHPGFRSTAWADQHRDGRPLIKVQHHHAHIAAAMAENGQPGAEPVIGFAFDGTGYGDDGAVWGGEVLVADYRGYQRVGHLGYVLLPGGDAGVRNPCRMALSHLRAAGIAWNDRLPSVAACTATERTILDRQLQTGLNSVPTSSMGRLFDAMSSLVGLCHRVAYEAEAAMRFEGLARDVIDTVTDPYRFALTPTTPTRATPSTTPPSTSPLSTTTPVTTDQLIIADPSPVLRAAAEDVLSQVPAAVVAARFHLAVAALVGDLGASLRQQTTINTVALSGGVFLNVLLSRLCAVRLRAQGFHVLMHHRVPPSDAGLALGQLVVGAALNLEEGSSTCA